MQEFIEDCPVGEYNNLRRHNALVLLNRFSLRMSRLKVTQGYQQVAQPGVAISRPRDTGRTQAGRQAHTPPAQSHHRSMRHRNSCIL